MGWRGRPISGGNSANCEGGLIGPPERHACNNDIRGLQVHLTLPFIVARVDELLPPGDVSVLEIVEGPVLITQVR